MSDLNVSKTQLTGPALAALKIRTEWSGPSLLSGKHETGQRGTMTDTRNSQRLSYKRNEKRKFCFVKHDASPKGELELQLLLLWSFSFSQSGCKLITG